MPPGRPRKEPKEIVTYPASKHKAPPFKPQRPSQVPGVASTAEPKSISRTISRTASGNAGGKSSMGGGFMSAGQVGGVRKKRKVIEDEDVEMGDGDEAATADVQQVSDDDDDDEDSDSDVLADPMTAKPKPKPAPKTAPPKRKPAPRKPRSPTPQSEKDVSEPDPTTLLSPLPPSSSIPQIPRALLLRLLHEHFASQTTKIDKNAVQVLEKYLELFVRETIERAKLAKEEQVGLGQASQTDEGWLEKGDLERVVAGVVMDF